LSYFRQRIFDGVYNIPQIGSGRFSITFRYRGPNKALIIEVLPSITLPTLSKIEQTRLFHSAPNNLISIIPQVSSIRISLFRNIAYGWGFNGDGRIGDNSTTVKTQPIVLSGDPVVIDWLQLSGGGSHSLGIREVALTCSGVAFSWGSNDVGQLGDNTKTNRSSPVSVVGGISDWCQVSAGFCHSLGLRSNGTVWAWGCNEYGRLGDNTTVNKSSPVSIVGGFNDWCQVSAGRAHNVGVRSNGTAWSWGFGSNGELGNLPNGSVIPSFFSSPVSAALGFSDWCCISTGISHTVGLRSNGTAWAWGYDGCGRLGDNIFSTNCLGSPVSVVGGITDWTSLSAGRNHTTGLRSNGRIFSWGVNNVGQLGDNTVAFKDCPVQLSGETTDWCLISAGGEHSLGLKCNGTLWAWGNGCLGQLGNNLSGSTLCRSSPVSVVGGITNWCQISAGTCHNLAVRCDGTAWSWGNNDLGELGNNTKRSRSSPIQVGYLFTEDESIYSVSDIPNSLLGPASLSSSTTPTNGNNNNGFWALFPPWNVKFGGVSYSVIYVGTNSYITFTAGSTLGTGLSASNPALPKIMVGAADQSAQRIYFGTEGTAPNRTYRIRFEGSVTTSGTLGSPTLLWEITFYENELDRIDLHTSNTNTVTPGRIIGVYASNGVRWDSTITSVTGGAYRLEGFFSTFNVIDEGFTDWCQVAAGNKHSLGIRTNGSLWSWGQNTIGALGDGTTVNRSSPVSVVGGITDWCQIKTSCQLSVALRCNGSLWSWGSNCHGQIGDDTVVDKSSPVSVVGSINWCKVFMDSSDGRTFASSCDCTLFAFGSNDNKEMGIGQQNFCASFPVSVLGGFTDWCQVSAGRCHSLGLRCNGSLWAWGNGSFGVLGNDNTETQFSPVSVVGGITDWCQVDAGSFHNVAVRCNGTAWSWGYNYSGQLGDDSIINKSSPVSVVGSFTNWCQASAGEFHSVALRSNGTAWSWGNNLCFRLGDDSSIDRSSPVLLAGSLSGWCQVDVGLSHNLIIRQTQTT
jgi:alpha-tubulin suppressor-like RCC1 family protein